MHELLAIECRNGPLPAEQRAIPRFGSRAAHERAQARAAIRHITRACMSAVDGAALRTLLENQKTWRGYLLALG
jgi:hypothetical protein